MSQHSIKSAEILHEMRRMKEKIEGKIDRVDVRLKGHTRPIRHSGSLRLAVAADIPRLAELSVLGFQDSEIFRFERPRCDEFPDDAVASFVNVYRSQPRDPRAVVVMADEGPHLASPPPSLEPSHEPARRVVVCVASCILPEHSPRTGQFVVPHLGDPEPSPDRDLCWRRLDIFTSISDATEKEHFTGKTVCNKLVVHPSYQRRGHATSLLYWGQRLAIQDEVDQGVIPSHVGEPVYLSLGYEVIGEMKIPDDGEVEGFTQRVILYRAKR